MSPLDRIAQVLAVVAVALLLCIFVAVLCRPTTAPRSVVEQSAKMSQPLPAEQSPRDAAREQQEPQPLTTRPPTQEPAMQKPAPQKGVVQEPVTSKPEAPSTAESPLPRQMFPDPLTRPETGKPKAEPAVDLGEALGSRRAPALTKKEDPQMRRWTYTSGESFQGKFLQFRDNKVVIQAPDHTIKEVHPSKLSQSDRQWYTSMLRAKRAEELDERRARLAMRAPRAERHNRVVPGFRAGTGVNGWNYGFQANNYYPMGYNNTYRPGYYYYPPVYYGFGFGSPQYIRHHIHIEPPKEKPEPQSQQ